MIQDTFIQGIAQQYDATKTGPGQYRAALNCRVRKNVLEPSFKHVRINTVAGLHQALFSLDDKLILVVAGYAYQVTDRIVLPIGATGLSATAETIWHEAVPAPSDFFVGPNKRYASAISTTPLVAVLQDGLTQPALLSSTLTTRTAGTYAEWTFENPEYVPIGTMMAFTGTKLFVVSPDRTKQYQSVSGRPLDFVLSFNSNTGLPTGNADSTAVAVTTAPLTAILPSQDGGFIASTEYQMYSATPVSDLLVFDEPYLQPRALFPVGAVEQGAFASINGETAYISPAGIQLFNQTAQRYRESNSTPLGAPIVQLLKRPLAAGVCANADDYAYFAVETVFGPGIVVFDQQTNAFVGIDLVTSAVKEFAILRLGGLTRLFYITEGNELFEIPLYSGEKATAVVYFGEWTPVDGEGKQDTGRRHRVRLAHFGLTNVRAAGHLTARVYVDRRLAETLVVPISSEGTEPITADGSFPFAAELPSAVYPLAFPTCPRGYALGLRVDLACDCRLASLSVDTEVMSADSPKFVTPLKAENYVVVGNVRADSRTTTDIVSVLGRKYFAEATGTTEAFVLNSGQRVSLRTGGHIGVPFVAGSERLFIDGSAAIYDYSTLLAACDGASNGAFLLGSAETGTNTYGALFRAVREMGIEANAVAGDLVQDVEARAKDFFGHGNRPRYYLIEGRDIDFYCMSFPKSTGGSADLTNTGEFAMWLRINIASRLSLTPRRISLVLCEMSPLENATFAAWDFSRMGVHAVICAGSTTAAYARSVVNGALVLQIGQTAANLAIESTPRSANLKYTNTANNTYDTITIVS